MNEIDVKELFASVAANPAADRIDMDAVLRGGRRRHRIRVAATIGASLGALAIVGALLTSALPGTAPTPAAPTPTPSATASMPPVLVAQLPDQPCSFTSVPDLSKAPASIAGSASKNPVSQVVQTRVDRATAISSARGLSVSPGTSATAPAAAALISARSATIEGPFVSGDRCVWAVTVQAPYAASHGPSGSAGQTFDTYTYFEDAASGQGLGIDAGPHSLNVITGYDPSAG